MRTYWRAARDLFTGNKAWLEGHTMGREYWRAHDNIKMTLLLSCLAAVVGVIFGAGFLAGRL